MTILRFDSFSFDLETGELRKHDRPVKLQPQPTELLRLLLNRAGNIVTREEIQRTLWPDGTVVDYDQSINFCIKRIRGVLGDDPETPRFVETVPRRGYRFLASIDSEPQTVAKRPSWRWPLWAALAAVSVLAATLARGPVESTEDLPPPETRPFTSFEGHEDEPAFSPDGRQIAYTSNAGDDGFWHLYVKLVAGGEALQLTHAEANDHAPVWSPDGSQIAFLRDLRALPWGGVKQPYEILAVRALGGSPRVLGQTAKYSRPAWHPDGEHLVIGDTRLPITGLQLLSLRTGETRPFTFPPEGTVLQDATPAFSPDGKMLAFVRGPNSSLGAGELHVQPTAGGEPRRVTFGNRQFEGIAWTADGTALVFASPPRGGFETKLWKVPVAGGEPLPYEAHEGAVNPTVASNRLAYSREVRDLNVWRVSGPKAIEPKAPEKLIASTRDDFGAEYSPDGTAIALNSDRDGELAIWITDAKGRGARKLVGEGGLPRWSPEGDEIAYTALVSEDRRNVFAMNVRGGPPRPVTVSHSIDRLPSWSADGRWIYFSSLRTGTWEIFRVPREGGDAVQITRGGGQFPFALRDRLYYWIWGVWEIRSTGLEGGEQKTVLDKPANIWTIWNDDIVYVNRRGSKGTTIELFDPESGETREIAWLGERPSMFLGLSVSPDGQWILYTQNDHPGSDILLVENFRD